MSENEEIVRRIYADWERGDWSQTWWAHPEIQMTLQLGLSTELFKGLKEVGEGWARFLGHWENLALKAEQIRELDDGRILVFSRNSGRGKFSGIEVESVSTPANIFELRDGKVITLLAYWERDKLLRDQGIEE